MLTGLVLDKLPTGKAVNHRLLGKGVVLERTALLPEYLTLVRFPSRKEPGKWYRMAIFTDYLS